MLNNWTKNYLLLSSFHTSIKQELNIEREIFLLPRLENPALLFEAKALGQIVSENRERGTVRGGYSSKFTKAHSKAISGLLFVGP